MIRFAALEDLPLLPAIEAAAGTRFVGTSAVADADLPSISLAAFAAGLDGGSLWIAANASNQPVGFLLAEARPPWLHLRELDVHPDHNGHGHGRALIATAAAAARQLDCDQLSLTTFRDIPWNAPWYARQGFVELAGADLPDWLATTLAHEAALGLDPANRCAMVKPL